MKRLDRASGYFRYFDPISGRVVEGETRQCVHCGFTWIKSPESFTGIQASAPTQKQTRGTCLNCHGLICARPTCLRQGCRHFLAKLDDYELSGGKVALG